MGGFTRARFSVAAEQSCTQYSSKTAVSPQTTMHRAPHRAFYRMDAHLRECPVAFDLESQ